MTAIIDSDHKVIDCPHCKGKLNVEIERKPAHVKLTEEQQFTEIETLVSKEIEKRIPKKEKEEKPEVKVEKDIQYPSWMPAEYCPDGNCSLGGVHPNKNYKRKAEKKCKNCDQFAPKVAKKCAWCGENDFDDMDDEDLENMGINLPTLEEHTHEHS